MRIVKKILLFIGIFIGLLLIVAFFVNKEYTVTRAISIAKPKQEVYEYVKNIKNQDHYNKWVMSDPKMKKTFTGEDGSTGFMYAWDGEEAGKGVQEIKKLQPGESIECEIRFEKPMEGVAQTTMKTDSVNTNETRVTWSMAGKNKYPFNLMNLFVDKLLGSDLETSLTSLKNEIEKSK